MTHDAQCLLRVIDGLLFEALEGGEPRGVCPRESGQPERSGVCFISCAMLMRHAPCEQIWAVWAVSCGSGRYGRFVRIERVKRIGRV